MHWTFFFMGLALGTWTANKQRDLMDRASEISSRRRKQKLDGLDKMAEEIRTKNSKSEYKSPRRKT